MRVVAVFIVVGALGLLLIIAALVFGDFLDGLLPDVSLGDSGGLFSTEVVGGFLAAFGFAAALVEATTALGTVLVTLIGLGAGVAMGGVAFALTSALIRMPTDATPRSSDLVGAIGTVITRIPESGLGEVSLTSAGHRLKMSARADTPIAAGTSVVVVDVTSPTSVVVTESGF